MKDDLKVPYHWSTIKLFVFLCINDEYLITLYLYA